MNNIKIEWYSFCEDGPTQKGALYSQTSRPHGAMA